MYRISINRNRPDFRVFIDLLYGEERNVDTEGDSVPVNSRDWTYLYVADRESDDPCVEIYASEEEPGIFEVVSESQELEALAALYLFEYCGTEIKTGDSTMSQQELEKLRQKYVLQLQRAEHAVWHQSSNENPYPNIA